MSLWAYLLLPVAFVVITWAIAWCIESFLAQCGEEPNDEDEP